MTYEDFFSTEDVETFKNVKRGQMRLARIAREVAARIVGGSIQESGKEFVVTSQGVFRLAMGTNSDNSTEQFAHDQYGAETIFMGDDSNLAEFFERHGRRPASALVKFRTQVEVELRGNTTP